MKRTIIFKSKEDTKYLYDIQNKYILIFHPKLEKANSKIHDSDSYYLKKIEYLKNHGFFLDFIPDNFETKIDGSVIRNNIAKIGQIVFEVTDHCNLNCKYCSLGELYEFKKENKRNINEKDAIDFLKYIFEIKKRNSRLMISFFGGEPLMNIDFIKKVVSVSKELNKNKNIQITFSMTTNALLLNKNISFLVENNFYLLISLDGDVNANTYRRYINDRSSFNRVIKNIDILYNNYPEFFDSNVDFNSVLHDKNSVSSIYDFIFRKYQKIPRISELNSTHLNLNRRDVFREMFHSRRESENDFLLQEVRESKYEHSRLMANNEFYFFIKNFSINYYIKNVLYLCFDIVNIKPTGSCVGFQKKIFFNTNSELLPCEKVSRKYSFGVVSGDVAMNVENIADRISRYYDKIITNCKYCYAYNSCYVCLFTLDNIENIDCEGFICPGFLDENRFAEKLSRVLSYMESFHDDVMAVYDNINK